MHAIGIAVGRGLTFAGLAIAAIGAWILFGQVQAWLKLGVWNPISVLEASAQAGIPVLWPEQHIVGLQQIIDRIATAIYGMPASLFCFGVGGGVVLVGISLEIYERRPNSN